MNRSGPLRRSRLRTAPPARSAPVRKPQQPHWPRHVASLIDWRDSDYAELWPHTRCQWCGHVIPQHAYRSRQNRLARGMGGTSDPLLKTVVNGLNLCGSATGMSACGDNCHLKAERRTDGRDGEGYQRGMWLDHGESPLLRPVIRWDGIAAWPTSTGKWIFEAPAGGTP